MEVLVRSDWDPFERIGDQWGSSLGAIEAGTLLSMETCFTVSHFLAQPPLAHCQCHFEGSRQIYGYLDMPVVELQQKVVLFGHHVLYIALNPLFVSRAAVSQKSILQKYLTRVSHKSLQSQECLTKVWYKTVTSYSLPRVSYSQQITRARYKWASHKSGIASQRHVVVFSHVFSRTLDSPCFVRVCGSHCVACSKPAIC